MNLWIFRRLHLLLANYWTRLHTLVREFEQYSARIPICPLSLFFGL